MPFYTTGHNTKHDESLVISEQNKQDNMQELLLFNNVHSEPHNEEALFSHHSLIEDEREAEEASIDDQLFAWAHSGSRWIIDAALPLDG